MKVFLPILTAILAAFTLASRAAEVPSPVPLTDLCRGLYLGFTGGLYADGKNEPSGAQADSLRKMSSAIQPLDKDGKPDPQGKIVVVGIGASVCVQIFQMLEEMGPGTAGKRPEVVFVNCAKGGHDVNKISDPGRHYWESAKASVENAGFSPAQVQAAWYQSDELRDTRDDFPGRPQRLQESIAKNMRELKQNFPNTRICYHSARHTTAFMPGAEGKNKHAEPRPWQVGWAVKWLVEEQSQGTADLAFEGPNAKAPLIAWATYFWTGADQPRGDGYRWSADMNLKDGVHLTDAGQRRVAKELLDFWHGDAFARNWFSPGSANLAHPAESPAGNRDSKAQVIAAKILKPDEPALLINGKSKFAKLERLLATSESIRLVAFDSNEKKILEIDDVFHKRSDLNKLLGSGEFRLHFLGKDGERIKMTMEVPDVVKIK